MKTSSDIINAYVHVVSLHMKASSDMINAYVSFNTKVPFRVATFSNYDRH